jgi:hypothetical protein
MVNWASSLDTYHKLNIQPPTFSEKWGAFFTDSVFLK